MRLSQELKTLNELRDYAAMLLQEAQEMYAADTQADKSADERRSRLKDTIECARQLYAQRASLEGIRGGHCSSTIALPPPSRRTRRRRLRRT